MSEKESDGARRRIAVGGAILCGIVLLGLSVPALHWQFGMPVSGISLRSEDGGPAVVESVNPEGTAAAAAVQPGDTLISVGGIDAPGGDADPMRARAFPLEIQNEYRAGEEAEWVVVRGGQRRSLSAPFVGVSRSRLISLVVVIGAFWLLAWFLLWARPDREDVILLVLTIFLYTPNTLFWFNTSMAVNTPLGFTLHQVWILSMFLGPALVIHFGAVFPVCTLSDRARRRVLWAAYGLCFLAIYLVEQTIFVGALRSPDLPYAVMTPALEAIHYWHVRLWIAIGCFLVSGYLMLRTYRRVPDDDVRDRVKWVLWSVFLAAGIDALVMGVVIYAGNGLGPGVGTFRNYLYLLIPAGLLLAVFRHDLFDVDAVIRASVVYFGTTGVLFLLFAVTEAVVSETLEAMLPTRSRTVGAATAAVLVGGLFQPLRNRLRTWMKRVLPLEPPEGVAVQADEEPGGA